MRGSLELPICYFSSSLFPLKNLFLISHLLIVSAILSWYLALLLFQAMFLSCRSASECMFLNIHASYASFFSLAGCLIDSLNTQ